MFTELYRELKLALEPLGKVFLELAEQVMPLIVGAVKSLAGAFNSSLMFSGFGFKPPASGFQFYFYGSL